jgi:hypothetical protein
MSSSNNKDFLEKYCDEFIIKESGINRKIIVLCEGGSDKLLKDLVENPPLGLGDNFLEYQDASFYQRSVPTWWRDTQKDDIIFHVCGNQSNVITAYFYIIKKYQEKNDKRLDVNKVYAFVDIDFEKDKLSDINKKHPEISIGFSSLEYIYHDLYVNGNVNHDVSKKHKIWVTGLIHKEAYFFIPPLKTILPSEISLEEKYFDILNEIENIKDFSIDKAKRRIAYHELSEKFKSVQEFKQLWQENFNNPEITEIEKEQLIYALLTVAKPKATWIKIIPHATAKNKEIETYRNQLSHKIALEFYSKQPRESPHHIPSFFNALSTTA